MLAKSWQNLYLIAFIFSIKQKEGSSVDSNREDGQIKYLLKVKKSFEGSVIFCMEQETREKQKNCLGHAESSAEVGQYEFKVFPNFSVFWFPLTGLRCPGANTRKTDPSGINQEWKRSLLICRKHNGSKGLAIRSHSVWKKTAQHTSAGSKRIGVLLQRATTELTAWWGQRVQKWSQLGHSSTLAVWSLANT